jgi:hypothetical protein
VLPLTQMQCSFVQYGVRLDLEMVIYVNIRIVPSIGSVGRLDNTTSSLAVAQYHVFISIII